jgi:hypothetical protein
MAKLIRLTAVRAGQKLVGNTGRLLFIDHLSLINLSQEVRMPFCNCQVYCRGGKTISIRAYQRHKPFRNQIDQFSVEFAAFVAAAKRMVNSYLF